MVRREEGGGRREEYEREKWKIGRRRMRRGGEIGKERFRKVNGRGERVEIESITITCLETQNS